MSLKEVKVNIPDLEIGMYVTRLDRPWLETPYLLQGFELKTPEDIQELSKYCEFVYIDIELGKDIEQKHSIAAHSVKTDDSSKNARQNLTGIEPVDYIDTSEFDDELKTAHQNYVQLSEAAEDILDEISKNRKLDLPVLQEAITPMVDSVIRNPDAFSWLTRLKHKDNYTYNHSVSSSVWCVAFGRHLGLPKKDLQSLAIGGLLADVGKIRLPEKLINNTERFNQYEFKLIRKHVEYGVEIVSSINGITPEVIDMVRTHHERHDGNGYPAGLSKNRISIFGKIAGIVDCYDAMVSDRPYAAAMSPHEAVKMLYDMRDREFQSELVEQFIQVVGIYPVGTVVEMSDERVGVIVAQHRIWRLRPKVMMLLDEDKRPLNDFETIDLYHVINDHDNQPLDIVRSVDPSVYGIDPQQFYL